MTVSVRRVVTGHNKNGKAIVKIDEVAKNIVEPLMPIVTSGPLLMNGKKWDGLSKVEQEQIESVSGEWISRLAGMQWDARNAIASDMMAKAGIKTTVASDKDVARIQEIADKLEADWFEEVGKKGVDGKAALQMLRSEAAKVTKELGK